MDPYVLTRPVHRAGPVLVEVPHAGLEIPSELAARVRPRPDDALRDADPFVDKIVDGAAEAGATLLCAQLSRYVVDLNRAPDDVSREVVRDHPAPSPTQPRGVVWATTTDGRVLWPSPIDFAELTRRLERYHAPYHAVIERELERLRTAHGWALLLSVHSMPSVARGARRADVVPGTRGRATADGRIIDLVDAHFAERGLSVRHDDPYRGGYTTARYGRPDARLHAVQVELSRALYLDERTLTLDHPRLRELNRTMLALIERLVRMELS